MGMHPLLRQGNIALLLLPLAFQIRSAGKENYHGQKKREHLAQLVKS